MGTSLSPQRDKMQFFLESNLREQGIEVQTEFAFSSMFQLRDSSISYNNRKSTDVNADILYSLVDSSLRGLR